ncbi:MAG: hypothetical protein KC713_09900 [Candidatus Omnitrophica bacterium]|nr:hypothetical protein [Candidatus Omnitrophota bacterium]
MKNNLLLGPDTTIKDQKIRESRDMVLKTDDARRLDYDVLYAHKLSADELKKTLTSYPAVGAKRLVVLHEVDRLTSAAQRILLEFLNQPSSSTVLIAESVKSAKDAAFIKKLSAVMETITCGRASSRNVFDVTNAIADRSPGEALKILSALWKEGQHPLQILGGLVWFWGRQRNRLKKDRFMQGLNELQNTDYLIKRSRLPAEHAVEVLIVKLSRLL